MVFIFLIPKFREQPINHTSESEGRKIGENGSNCNKKLYQSNLVSHKESRHNDPHIYVTHYETKIGPNTAFERLFYDYPHLYGQCIFKYLFLTIQKVNESKLWQR